jgi:hypothetical protein
MMDEYQAIFEINVPYGMLSSPQKKALYDFRESPNNNLEMYIGPYWKPVEDDAILLPYMTYRAARQERTVTGTVIFKNGKPDFSTWKEK